MADEPVPSIEISSKDVGTTWIHQYEGKLWPVVICDQNTVAKTFFDLRSKDYHVPAILLGRHKYVWVMDATLQEYDPNYDYASDCESFEQQDLQPNDSKDIANEKLRRMAFKTEAPEFRDHVYWHNYILSESEVRRMQRKRSRQQSFDGDDIEVISARRRSRTSSNSPEDPSDRSKRTKRSNYAQSKQLLTPKSTPNGKRYGSTGIIDISDDEMSDDDDNIIVAGSSQRLNPSAKSGRKNVHRMAIRAKPSFRGMSPPRMTENSCRILLAGNDQGVIVSRARCAESDYLRPLEQYDEKRGEHIIDLNQDQRAVELKLTHAELVEVWPYLFHGDFGPKLQKAHDDYRPYGKLSDADKEDHAKQLAFGFVTASKLQLVGLQDLIEKKLNALYPLPPIALLTVALVLTRMPSMESQTDPQEKVVEWLVGSLAAQFWNLAKNHTGALQRLLHDNDAFREAVYHKMQINADEGMEGCEEL